MQKTHLIAKQLYMAGKFDAAWEVAQLDEGLLPNVTRDQWEDFMIRCINAE